MIEKATTTSSVRKLGWIKSSKLDFFAYSFPLILSHFWDGLSRNWRGQACNSYTKSFTNGEIGTYSTYDRKYRDLKKIENLTLESHKTSDKYAVFRV